MAAATAAKPDPISDPQYYTRIPPSPDQTHQREPHNYIILPHYASGRRSYRCCRRSSLSATISIILIAAAVFVFWPSDPELTIVRLRLNSVKFHRRPHIAIDVSLAVTVKVRNRDFYSIDFTRLDVAIGYRGKELGHVTSSGGHLKARRLSYVEAMVEFDGVEVISDWIYLLDDLAKGMVPFDTVTKVDGRLVMGFFDMPLEAKITCEIDVNTRNHTVIRQNCYPEA